MRISFTEQLFCLKESAKELIKKCLGKYLLTASIIKYGRSLKHQVCKDKKSEIEVYVKYWPISIKTN